MELNKCVDIISACQVDKIHHSFQVCFIKLALLGLDSRPHNSKSDTIDPFILQTNHLIFSEFSIIVGWIFLDNIDTMEDSFPTILVIDFVVLDVQERFSGCQCNQ